MSKRIGTYEARTDWSEVMQEVRKGERFVITHHGEPINRGSAEPVRARACAYPAEYPARIDELTGDSLTAALGG